MWVAWKRGRCGPTGSTASGERVSTSGCLCDEAGFGPSAWFGYANLSKVQSGFLQSWSEPPATGSYSPQGPLHRPCWASPESCPAEKRRAKHEAVLKGRPATEKLAIRMKARHAGLCIFATRGAKRPSMVMGAPNTVIIVSGPSGCAPLRW